MSELQAAKTLVLAHYADLHQSQLQDIADTLARRTASNWHWRSYYPFNEQYGARNVAQCFWQPLMQSVSCLQRRQDIFFAGRNQMDNFKSTWVVSMGHLSGLLDKPFLGIPATGKMAFLRYCEFNRIESNTVTETAFFIDLPHLMLQAGLRPFSGQRGAHLIQPGPVDHSGLCFGPSHPDEGQKTLAAINTMIGHLGHWQSGMPLEDELAQDWHDDMVWWGPAGIGATYTIARYARQHAAPFRAAFTDRSATSHICRLAEGHYGGFFGWPNFTAIHTGGFLNMPASNIRSEFRVIDIYRRQGEKLAENWVFIDIPHWLKQQGIEILPLPLSVA